MSIEDWIKAKSAQLTTAGIATARLDCLVLLEDELSKDRSWILSHLERNLQITEIENLSKNITQRAKHIPLAYIRGHTEFYGRNFLVNAHTLVPRPETETMIELLKYTLHEDPFFACATLIDIGTGSGAIAITAKLEFPQTHVIALDIDNACLEVAHNNARAHDTIVECAHSDLLGLFAETEVVAVQVKRHYALPPTPCILLCNLPYVPNDFHINTAATHEPPHALFGGRDGLDIYRKLFVQISLSTEKPHYVFTESMPTQHKALTAIAEANDYHLGKTDDFIQIFELDTK